LILKETLSIYFLIEKMGMLVLLLMLDWELGGVIDSEIGIMSLSKLTTDDRFMSAIRSFNHCLVDIFLISR
jgi:hypothetical protein